MRKPTMGDYEVFASGVINSFSGCDITIPVDGLMEDGKEYTINIENTTDNTTASHQISGKKVQDGILVTLTNFSDPFGIGPNKPIKFGTRSDGRDVYLHLVVYSIEDTKIMTLIYSVFIDRTTTCQPVSEA